MGKYLLAVSISAGVCLLLTPSIRRLAMLVGAIDMPDRRRVHQVPTPRLGGLGLLIAIAVGLAVASAFDPFAFLALSSSKLLGASAAVGMVAIVGFCDDIFGLPATTKLLVEVLASLLAFASGYRIDALFGLPLGWLSFPATLLWIVVVTNSFNLVDGMDGLAAGTGAIISASLFMLSLSLGSVQGALVLAALTGALVGFLVFNFPPARIFLGDSGALSIGVILALISVETANKLAAGLAILVPALALGLPLAEVTITVLRRALRGIHVVRLDEGKERYEFLFVGKAALFSADRDHIHHRLLSLGLSGRKAVLILYVATAFACAAGFALTISRGLSQALLLATCGIAAFTAFRHLGYEELRPLSRGTLMPIFDWGSTQRSLLAFVDLGCVAVCYLGALATITQPSGPSFRAELLRTFPPVCFAQLSALAFSGIYRRSYRYAAIADVGPLVGSVGLAGLTGFFAAWLVVGKPAIAVSVLDTYFLSTLIFASRLSFRLLDHARAGSLRGGRPVLIYGAGRAGMLALTELRSNPDLCRFAVGFLDDDPAKQRSRVWGLTVYGASSLSKLIEGGQFAELLVASAKIPVERVREITIRCNSAGIQAHRLMVDWPAVQISGLSRKSAKLEPLFSSVASDSGNGSGS